ncbi:MAG: DUF503 domain-containing protein [Tissierellia bacterium]|nr:DUF503 domain-containing protein [Tissierellia bacterium]
MALVHMIKADLYLPQVQNLKEKRAIRLSLTHRLKTMNISVIEVEDADILQRLILLLCYCALNGGIAAGKREGILELFYAETDHLVLEEETMDLS